MALTSRTAIVSWVLFLQSWAAEPAFPRQGWGTGMSSRHEGENMHGLLVGQQQLLARAGHLWLAAQIQPAGGLLLLVEHF